MKISPSGSNHNREMNLVEDERTMNNCREMQCRATITLVESGEKNHFIGLLPKRPGDVARTMIGQSGASIIELTILLPTLLLLGLGSIQFGLLFVAKNNINYAGFEAARAGAMGNANIDTIVAAYKKALIPMYGGGLTADQLTQSYERAKRDTGPANLKIELQNPTVESFADWNAKALQDDERVGNGARVIPVLMQNFPEKLVAYKVARNPEQVGPTSGQNLSDASLIKLKITHGYRPQVPLLGKVFTGLGAQFGDRSDPFATALYREGRIPVVSHVTMQMHSDAIESVNASNPGRGNGGNPGNPAHDDAPYAPHVPSPHSPPPQSPDINPGTPDLPCGLA